MLERKPETNPLEWRKRPIPTHPRNISDEAWSVYRDIGFSHCDPAGIVYTPRFIDLVNGVIEELFLKELKIDYHKTILKDRVGLGYASVDTDFFAPATMGDRLLFTPIITHIGRCSAIFHVHCVRDVREIMACRLVMVTTSLNTNQAISIPAALKEALQSYKDRCR
jgi:4-hydroxybenzoyl-CoA thioesterase